MHPFLAEDFEVRWSTLTAAAIEPDIQHALAAAKEKIAQICQQDPAQATYQSTFGALEQATEPLERGWGRLQHLDSVCDQPEQREALNRMLPAVTEFYASIPLNPELWSILHAYGSSAAAHELDPVRRRFVEETMTDFVQAGADLPPTEKERLAAIQAELSKCTKRFAENVLDSTNAWELIVTDEARLEGLPASALAAARASAEAKGHPAPAWRFTLQFPSMFPVLQHAADASLRREIWEGSITIGAKGEWDNTDLIQRILELRQELAEILGHPHFPDLVLQRRMARDGATALGFIHDLHQRIAPQFQREYRELCEFKAAKLDAPPELLEPWEVAYWAEQQRQEQFDLDDEILRPYFPVGQVMSGLFELASRLFGIRIEEREAVHYPRGHGPTEPDSRPEVWSEEVRFYEVRDQASGEHLGSFYADWHPREEKRGGAWMNPLAPGLPPHGSRPRQPHLALITGNMSPPVDGQPALLTHSEVETIFHEFGHLLHVMLSEVEVRSLAATNVPWDFVELPSQIMENFCWDRQSLDLFARHHETGEVIPDELFERMLAARNHMSASAFMRQLSLGKLDLELHLDPQRLAKLGLDPLDETLLHDYRAELKTPVPSMARRFSHLFSSATGYAAGYYSYKWAEVLDADAFTKFQAADVLSPTVGRAFRDEILATGNSRPVEESFRRFMGRDPRLEPLLERSGLTQPAAS